MGKLIRLLEGIEARIGRSDRGPRSLVDNAITELRRRDMVNTLELLQKTRELFASPEITLNQDGTYFARKAWKHHPDRAPEPVYSDTCMCIVGGMIHLTDPRSRDMVELGSADRDAITEARYALIDQLPKWFLDDCPESPLETWNDRESTTKDDMIRLLDAAINDLSEDLR